MKYDLFKLRWTVLGSMMLGLGAALAATEFPPIVRAVGAMLSAGGAAISAFFHKRREEGSAT
jgi:hypothetical protein